MRVNKEARAAAAAQKRADTRDRLLEAAVQVIADKGPEAVSVEDFVAAAGVSRGTFYNYFPTVHDLILALNIRIRREVDLQLAPVRTEVTDPAGRIAAILHRIWLIWAQDPLKGWVGARIEASGAPRQPFWDQEFTTLFGRAVNAGQFRGDALPAARTIVFGAMRMGVRDLYAGEVEVDHAVPLVALLLVVCGMDREAAWKLSREHAVPAQAAIRPTNERRHSC